MTDIRDEVAAALRDTTSCTERCDHESVEWVWSSVDAHADALMERLAARGLTVVREGELDVERLARAMGNHLPEPWADLEIVDLVAAEYARLARQPEDQP